MAAIDQSGPLRVGASGKLNFYLEALAINIKAFASNFHLNLPRLNFRENRCHKLCRGSVSKLDNCGFSYTQLDVSTIWTIQQPKNDENNAVVAYPDAR
jgi:hypothetical protein